MALDFYDCVLGLIPHVGISAEAVAGFEGRAVDFIESVDAKGRDHVLAKVFVLVVAPY